MKHFLGEFEEIILLTILILGEDAYGVSIKEEMENRLRRKVSIGALHTALQRMTTKGYVTSDFGEVTKERGGKRKRYFRVSSFGLDALEKSRLDRLQLWASIPRFSSEPS